MHGVTGRLFFMSAAIFPLLITGACGKTETKAAAAKGEEIIAVQVISVQPTNLIRTINSVGTVRHRRETPLGFTTSGKVASMRYDVGDYVKRGALIAALDTTVVGADLNVAMAESNRADAEFSRIAALYKDGWVTKARFEAAQSVAIASSARVSQAGFARGTAQLYAPSSGVVLARNAQPGQVVSAGTPAIILGQDNEGFVFRVPIIDSDASKLRVGMPGEIMIESLGGGPIKATISEIDGRANEATGAFTVQFSISTKSGVKSGQIGSAKISLPAVDDGSLQIPASSLFGVRTGEGLVYVVNPKNNRVETRNVLIQRLTDGFVIVSGGINLGETIVVSGTEKLRTGSKVTPVRAAP